ESHPEPAPRTIGLESARMAPLSERGPRHASDGPPARQFEESRMLVGDPEASRGVLRDGRHGAGYVDHRPEAVVVEIAETACRRDPDSPAVILQERVRVPSVELAVAVAAGGAEGCDLPVPP